MKMNIQLHIEELLLDGFDPRDRRRIADALERELARLFRVSDLKQFSGQGAVVSGQWPVVSGQSMVSRSRHPGESRCRGRGSSDRCTRSQYGHTDRWCTSIEHCAARSEGRESERVLSIC